MVVILLFRKCFNGLAQKFLWKFTKYVFSLIYFKVYWLIFWKLEIPKRLTVERYWILTIDRCFASVKSFNLYNSPARQVQVLLPISWARKLWRRVVLLQDWNLALDLPISQSCSSPLCSPGTSEGEEKVSALDCLQLIYENLSDLIGDLIIVLSTSYICLRLLCL